MRTVAILTPSFYDYDGSRIFFGGGERYLWELTRLLHEMGYQVEIFQAATQPWKQVFRGVTFHGLHPFRVEQDLWPLTNQLFQKAAAGFDHHLYFTWAMAYPEVRPGSIAISHGVWWDDPEAPHPRTAAWTVKMVQALRKPACIVANDTNLINWVRATEPALASTCTFMPNFVDLQLFRPLPKEADGLFRVLFPRRLVPQRGLREALAAAQILTGAHADLCFLFVGRGDPAAEARLAELARTRRGVEYAWLEPEQMPGAYQRSDLVLIPSVAAEGTSLSCLEAMACGRPVIAGWVGGLANLIIHEYNGLLVPGRPETLCDAILRLKADPALRSRFAERGVAVATVHSLERWRARWRRLIETHLS